LTDVSALGEPVTFPSGGLTLEGLIHQPQPTPHPAVVVCHPHPLFGGDMHNSVVVAVCQALVKGGIAALRFNFRGVGRSLGRFGEGVGERADTIAALAYLRQREGVEPAKVGVVGYSFGAAVALAAADETVAALAAISPPNVGRAISAQAIRCPILLITGDADDVSPPAHVTSLAQTLGPQCQVEVVPGADHFWWGHEDKLTQIVGGFFRDSLRPGP
jgi:alpha/beta superfamily hydrolase